ncbi:MFS transporter [Microbacterium sediminis]|uniref:MFS transporter n=1 Tax=Microbacterium sediminis TaxID=904291 RepID=A0A1B9N9F4_9MICO|nr:MFS transporter [Microbacterium sediminis]QBR75481.1 MFS transporter [Microbacterium sediminis]
MVEGADRAPRETIWSPRYVWVTLGAFALIFLAAVQSLAVTTVMPAVSDALHGEALYAVAFSGTLATSVIGMVAVGAWSDRTGPVVPLYAAVGMFVAGLLIDTVAPTMEVLVLGRLVLGLGSGGQIVALYVVVARIFPAALHGRVFALFSAAWIVPSLVGPFVAGAVAEFLHWRWVFGGVAVLAVAALLMIAPRLRGINAHAEHPAEGAGRALVRRLLLAVVVAAAALGLALSGELADPWSWVVAAAALAVVGIAVVPLLPRGTLRAAPGLPSVILMRGVLAGGFFGAEVYIPKLFIDRYGWSSTFAGLGLTIAGITWALGAELSARHADRVGDRRLVLAGVGLLSSSIGLVLASAVFGWPGIVPAIAWGIGGLGMGFVYARLSVLMLAYSSPRDQGFNSSALQISDAVGSSAVIAIMGLLFLAIGPAAGFPAVFVLGILIVLLTLVPGLRMGGAGAR